MTYLTFLESLLHDAAKHVMEFPRGLTVSVKKEDPNQVVTAADAAVGNRLKKRIHERFPDDSIIDEESGTVLGSSPLTWVIDPIDGTSNFAVGSPLFGVMVGVLEHGKPVAGGVALPALSDVYVAEAGQGAYHNGVRIQITPDVDPAEQLIAYGMDIHPSEIELDCRIVARLASRCRGIRMSNSVFDCMMVASGTYGAFLHRRNRIWDCVAPHAIIAEAGGAFSDMNGRSLDYTNPTGRISEVFSILACGSGAHEPLTHTISGGIH
ncbi:inositol monophosphatase family protein [Streptomyces sp. NPDC052042]|uniref:inositol monophosphatase family protein n=1 Tax=Streptomyces sp. NPDC052042 TaxID=3365683 RepID=UPI0037D66847